MTIKPSNGGTGVCALISHFKGLLSPPRFAAVNLHQLRQVPSLTTGLKRYRQLAQLEAKSTMLHCHEQILLVSVLGFPSIVSQATLRMKSSAPGLTYDNRGYMDVSENSGTPKSSILIGFSIINHPFWGTPIFGNTHIDMRVQQKVHATGFLCVGRPGYVKIIVSAHQIC